MPMMQARPWIGATIGMAIAQFPFGTKERHGHPNR